MPSRIGDALHWYATYTPTKTAIISAQGEQSYAQLWTRVRRLANSLTKLGIDPGDRIALLLQNSGRYLELYQAAALLGIAVVPLNFRFVASEVEYVVNHSGAKALVFDAAFMPTIELLRDKLPTIGSNYIVTDKDDLWEVHSYERLVDAGHDVDPAVPADLNACYFQGYTSGTTGFPKGCVNPHREFADCLRRMATIYGITPEDREFVAAPLFHEAPALFSLLQLFRGGTVIVINDSTPENVFSLIDKHRATWAFMVPTMWALMVTSKEIDKYDLGSLHSVISGGSPLLTHIKEVVIKRLPRAGLHEFYGGTEVGLVTNLGPTDQTRQVRSVGKPVIGIFVGLRDEGGNPVAHGHIRRIHIRVPTLVVGYFKNPPTTPK